MVSRGEGVRYHVVEEDHAPCGWREVDPGLGYAFVDSGYAVKWQLEDNLVGCWVTECAYDAYQVERLILGERPEVVLTGGY